MYSSSCSPSSFQIIENEKDPRGVVQVCHLLHLTLTHFPHLSPSTLNDLEMIGIGYFPVTYVTPPLVSGTVDIVTSVPLSPSSHAGRRQDRRHRGHHLRPALHSAAPPLPGDLSPRLLPELQRTGRARAPPPRREARMEPRHGRRRRHDRRRGRSLERPPRRTISSFLPS